MTKEQELKIQLLKDFTKMDFSNPMGWTGYYDTELKELSEAIETVLSMLKEKDKEIEHWKNGFERELEDNRKNTYELLKQDLIIRQKDKQIDLMAGHLIGIIFSDKDDIEVIFENKEDAKQYFERKVEKEWIWRLK